MSKFSSFIKANPRVVKAVVSAVVSTVKQIAGTWFDNFRAPEFATFVGGSYVAGHSLAAQCNLSPSVQHTIGSAMAATTAIAYIRNPKKADWVAAPTADPSPTGEEDTMDESRDKDAQLELPLLGKGGK